MRNAALIVILCILGAHASGISNLCYINPSHPFSDSLKYLWIFNRNGTEKVANNTLTLRSGGAVTWGDSGVTSAGGSNSFYDVKTPFNITGAFTLTWRSSLQGGVSGDNDNMVFGDITRTTAFIDIRGYNSLRIRNEAGDQVDFAIGYNVGSTYHTYSLVSVSSTQLMLYVDGTPVDTLVNLLWTGRINFNVIMSGYNTTQYNYKGTMAFVSYHKRVFIDSVSIYHSGFPNIQNPSDTLVFLAHGQSNMAGRGDLATKINPRFGSYLWRQSTKWFDRLSDPFCYTDAAPSKSLMPAFADSLAKYFIEQHPATPPPAIVIVPGAVGGRGMTNPTDNWSTITSPVYTQAESIAVAVADSLGGIDYVLFDGFESDLGIDTSVVYNGICTYMNNIRSSVGAPNLKFIYSLPYDAAYDYATIISPLRRQIQRVVNDSAFCFIGPDKEIISGRRDAWHLTDLGYDSLGWGFATAYIAATSEPPVPAVIDSVTPRPQRGKAGSIVKFYAHNLPDSTSNMSIRFNSINFNKPLRWSGGQIWDTIPAGTPRGYYRTLWLYNGTDTVAVSDTVFRVTSPSIGTTW